MSDEAVTRILNTLEKRLDDEDVIGQIDWIQPPTGDVPLGRAIISTTHHFERNPEHLIELIESKNSYLYNGTEYDVSVTGTRAKRVGGLVGVEMHITPTDFCL